MWFTQFFFWFSIGSTNVAKMSISNHADNYATPPPKRLTPAKGTKKERLCFSPLIHNTKEIHYTRGVERS